MRSGRIDGGSSAEIECVALQHGSRILLELLAHFENAGGSSRRMYYSFMTKPSSMSKTVERAELTSQTFFSRGKAANFQNPQFMKYDARSSQGESSPQLWYLLLHSFQIPADRRGAKQSTRQGGSPCQ